jgi:hypothetical protein
MRKLKLEMQVSVDGFTADGDGNTDWMVWSWGTVTGLGTTSFGNAITS